MADGTRMQQRRATEAVWETSNYVLSDGELGVTTDTGIIKIGDGVTAWLDLDPAFGSEYLPTLGKAADSELLDGISSAEFVQIGALSTNPLADTVALRTSDGRLKVAAATESNDAVTLDGVATAPGLREMTSSRLVTANFTIAVGDIGKRVVVTHSSTTNWVTATLPENATLAMPIGSWIDIVSTGNGAVKIVPSGSDVIRGFPYVLPNYGLTRIVRTSTLEWLAIPMGHHNQQKNPSIRILHTVAGRAFPNGTYTTIPYDSVDTAATWNPGNEWFSVPGTGLVTSRRIIVNQAGEYDILVNFSGSISNQTYLRLVKMTADATAGDTLATDNMTVSGNVVWRGRLTAGESIGASQGCFSGANTSVEDGSGGNRNELRITRVGN